MQFIVMEFLDGETVEEVMACGGTSCRCRRRSRLVRQALAGLQHLHDRRTVHRDIKPANLMVTPGGRADHPG